MTRFDDPLSVLPEPGLVPEYMEAEAALAWYQNADPRDGDRWGDYFVKDGQLWNDGSGEPYSLWTPAREDYDAAEAFRYDDLVDEVADDDSWGR